jgi:hypothetical protein
MPDSFPADCPHPAAARLKLWERRGLILFLAVLVVFGLIVEKRSAFMQRRMTDLGVYLRAAWAVRTGANIYRVTDNNDWHYQYPPLFAILMVPLADPPAGADRAGMLPYAVAVALWYVFNVTCLALAVHVLASALEERSGREAVRRQPAGCRRWWALRVLPVLACAAPVGHTLMRGQVNLLLLALICAALAALLRCQSVRAGWWLAGAICLKVIPAFLVLGPLWRRDKRCLAACGLGCVLGFIGVPAAVFGLSRTVAYYQEYAAELLGPALGTGPSSTRAKEIIEMTASDSQSFLAAIHNTLHLDRGTRPAAPSAAVRRAHWLIGGSLTALTLLVFGWRRSASRVATVIFFGALIVNMLLLSPVCHLHYFCLAVPLVMGLLAWSWEKSAEPRLGAGVLLLLGANLVTDILPNLQGLEVLRDMGFALFGAMLLWAAGCAVLCIESKQAEAGDGTKPSVSGLAA